MKTFLRVIGLILFFIPASFGQTKQPVLIGIDVLKPILSLATPNRPAYRLAEVAVKVPLHQTSLSIVGGYGQARSDTLHRNMLLTAQGYYLKIGLETPLPSGKGLVKGWHGLISTCHETGTYSFKGPTFGDYVAPTPERQRVAIGVEGILAHQMILTPRLLLRLSGRVTAAALLGPKSSDTPVYFVPGIGLTAGDPIVYTVGLGLHLFYQIPPRLTAVSSDDQNN